MKHLAIITSSLLLLTSSLFAGVPLRWTVETSRAQPATFDEFAGATYDLEATLQSYGKPLEVVGEPHLYWQTNGMGSAYWTAPATVSGHVLRATWTPACDVGARAYNCFIGITGTVYNAAFQFRLRPSPGAVPNVIDLPPRVLDLEHTIVINPPWPTDATIDARIRRVIDEDGITAPVETNVVTSIISNTVTKSFVEDLGISGGGSSGVDTNAVRDIAREVVSDATNAVPRIVIGENEIRADLTVTEQEHLSTWTVSYEGPYWDESYDPGMYPVYLESGHEQAYDGAGWYFSHPGGSIEGPSELNFTDRNALVLTRSTSFSWGTVTAARHLVPERTTKLATTSDLAAAISPVSNKADDALSAANDANVWSSATHAFMTGGRTNCWWSGTNYVFGADAATRHKFAWEDGMDAATVPCSMALYEIRDGVRECVWDQRDWTAWYWSFKAQQMEAAIQERIDSLGNVVTNDAMYAWAKRYASDGVRNPDPSTTFIDTPTVTLSPGMRWETVATVSGASYWTIVGDGAVIGGSGTNATLQIRDFEGNEIMTVTKGERRPAWLERGEIVGQMTDAQGLVCFDMLADAQPTGYFSTTLDQDDFVAETSDDCPASYEWEDIGGGKWRVHFTLKPGIQANSCFAKFMVEIEGQTIIRYNAGQEIQGGLIYNGVKIAPDVSGSPAVGTVIQWKVVH